MEQVAIEQLTSEIFAAALQPDPDLTIWEWADKYRVLPSESAEEHGPWRTSRAPYLKEIMEVLSPNHPARECVVMKASQLGFTEVGLNYIGYVVDRGLGSMLVVMPTVNIVKERFTKLRLDPTIQATPVLRAKFRQGVSRDANNTLTSKKFKGGMLILAGANSAASLSSMPIRSLFMDEIDKYPQDVQDEGDTISVAEKRTDNFKRAKILKGSTPGIKGLSRIEREYEQSDQRRFHVPCPHCGHMQWLKWGGKDTPYGIKFEHAGWWISGEVTYMCEKCHCLISEYQKPMMLEHGIWIPENEGAGRQPGFHISALYSPWKEWSKCAQEFAKAKRDRSNTLLKTFVQSVLGEPWEDKVTRVETESLYKNRLPYAHQVPEGACLLTAAVDTQNDRLECEVMSWGPGLESWGLDYQVFLGDPAIPPGQLDRVGNPSVWDHLDEYLIQTWEHASGLPLQIRCVCVDSGGHRTQAVYNYTRTKKSRGIYAIKGSREHGGPILAKMSWVHGKTTRLFHVGTDTAKDQIYGWMQLDNHGPGYMHFPPRDVNGYDDEYFRQLTSETVRFDEEKNVRIWAKRYSGIRNEALDVRVYNLAAVTILMELGKIRLENEMERLLRRAEDVEQDLAGQVPDENAAPVRRSAAPVRRQPGFVKRY